MALYFPNDVDYLQNSQYVALSLATPLKVAAAR